MVALGPVSFDVLTPIQSVTAPGAREPFGRILPTAGFGMILHTTVVQKFLVLQEEDFRVEQLALAEASVRPTEPSPRHAGADGAVEGDRSTWRWQGGA